MSNELKDQLRRILEAVAIDSPGALMFAGRRVPVDGSAGHGLPQVAGTNNPLIGALQMQLYQHCYCRPFTGSVSELPSPTNGGKDLTPELSQANEGQERWESGWRIAQVLSSGQLAVQRNGLSRLLWPGEYLSADGSGGMPRQGGYVSVFCKKQSTALQPGFYFAFGETLPDQQDEALPVRFYWNIKDSGVVELLRGVTKELNRFQVPFRFKCLTRAGLYERSDAAVLYVAKRLFRTVAGLLGKTYESAAPHLKSDTPLFSKRLNAGLGLAEDPGNGESFGSHRCRLVAEAVCECHAKGKHSPEERLQAVEERFQQNGLRLEAPYLGRGSVNSYDLPSKELPLL